MKEMISFTGTKTVKAVPMSRKEAEEAMNRKVYADSEDREDEHGYLVKYPDGYLSWSPKKVFEESYRVSETHIDRMKIEKDELQKRYMKLREFTFSDKFRDLTDDQRLFMRKQADQMESYLYTLCKRISLDTFLEEKRKFDSGATGKAMDPLAPAGEK